MPARPVRIGQVDVPALHQPPREDQLGAPVGRRRAGRVPPRRRPAARAARLGGRAQALRDRHGLPALQPLRAHDGPRERDLRAGLREARAAPAGARAGARVARQRRARRQGRLLPLPALRRAAAAGRDRAGAGDGAEADAVRRADLGARPRARRRGARRDARARPRSRHDDGRRHARDGVRARGRGQGRVHGRAASSSRKGRLAELLSNPRHERTRAFLSKVL